MLNRNKIRVGIVGANPSRGFASIAHIPALQALADFEISRCVHDAAGFCGRSGEAL